MNVTTGQQLGRQWWIAQSSKPINRLWLNPAALKRRESGMKPLTIIHKSWYSRKNRVILGSMTLESKQRLYGSIFRLKPLTERFYTEHLSMALLLLGDVPPSHHDAEDISAKRFVYKCKHEAHGGQHGNCAEQPIKQALKP
jgi:hypothetical protein